MVDEPREELTATVVSGTSPRPDPVQLIGRPGFIQVEVIGGPMDGDRRRVSTDSLTIGRRERNDLSLRHDPRISASHARVTREGEQYWLEDLGSSNGTFIGQRRIRKRASIGPGSIFVLGGTYLEFMPF